MLQQNPRRGLGTALLPLLIALWLAPLVAGCDAGEAPAPAASQANGAPARVASLVPAVTDLLLGLGQRDLLVAVSNYDTDPRVEGLPRVGDLLTIDWEQIAAVQPTHIVVQMPRDRMPPGAQERARELGATLHPVRIDRLSDIEKTIDELEAALTHRSQDLRWRAAFRQQLEAVLPPAPPERPVPTLVALASDLSFVAGRQNYLDDLLTAAGGANVVPAEMASYPRLDREMLMSLRPQRVALILPAPTDPQLAEARAAIYSLAPVWGLRWEDVILIDGAYAMTPGWSVLDIARRLTEQLATSQDPASAPATRPATRPVMP